MGAALSGQYAAVFGRPWPVWGAAVLVATVNVFLFAFDRPWTASDGARNWGDWVLNGLGLAHRPDLVAPWLYEALQVSSPHMATLGKRAVGIRVTDQLGERISFARATGLSRATAIILQNVCRCLVPSTFSLSVPVSIFAHPAVSMLCVPASKQAPCRPARTCCGHYSPASMMAMTGPPPCGP